MDISKITSSQNVILLTLDLDLIERFIDGELARGSAEELSVHKVLREQPESGEANYIITEMIKRSSDLQGQFARDMCVARQQFAQLCSAALMDSSSL
jgi:hypothetical protein